MAHELRWYSLLPVPERNSMLAAAFLNFRTREDPGAEACSDQNTKKKTFLKQNCEMIGGNIATLKMLWLFNI